MPGSTPPTSQLDWLSSTTAMIVLLWSRATRDLLKSFGWGIAALHRLLQRRSCHVLAVRPIESSSTAAQQLASCPFEAVVHRNRKFAYPPLEEAGIRTLSPPDREQHFSRRETSSIPHPLPTRSG